MDMQVMSSSGSAWRVSLRRNGLRPLIVRGDRLIDAAEHDAEAGMRFDIAVFQDKAEACVASLTCSYDADEATRSYAVSCADIDEARRFFEGYRPARDVPVNEAVLGLDCGERAAVLRCRTIGAETAYLRLLATTFPDVSVRHEEIDR